MDADQENNVEAATTMPCQPLPPPYMAPQFQGDGYAATPGYFVDDNLDNKWPTAPPSYSPEYNKPPGVENVAYVPVDLAPPNYYPPPMLDNSLPHHQQFQQHPNVVIVEQPGSVSWPTNVPLTNPPKDYMCYSVFVTLCCCWLIGVFAIAKSAECRSAINTGDRATAELKSREARSKAHLALVFGIISCIVIASVIGVYYCIWINHL